MSEAFDKVWHEELIFKLKSDGFSDSLLRLIDSFLSNRFQRVLLNGQTSEWLPVRLVCHKARSLDHVFFRIYINDLLGNLISTVKLFADDKSLFSIVNNNKISANELNKDLQKLSAWAYKWEMSFNPDLNKKAQQVVFSRKLNKSSHLKIFFNNAPVVCASWQKYLGMFLDESLNFSYHIKEKMPKAIKGIGIIKKFRKTLPRHALITICKSFVRSFLDYSDIIYDQPKNENLNQKIERIQYNAPLAITGSIKGTSQSKLYNELAFESLKFKVGFGGYVLFIKSNKLSTRIPV